MIDVSPMGGEPVAIDALMEFKGGSDNSWIFHPSEEGAPERLEVQFPERLDIAVPPWDGCCRVFLPYPASEWNAVQITTTSGELLLELQSTSEPYDGFHIRRGDDVGSCSLLPERQTATRRTVIFNWDSDVAITGGEIAEGTLGGIPMRGVAINDARGWAVFGRRPEE